VKKLKTPSLEDHSFIFKKYSTTKHSELWTNFLDLEIILASGATLNRRTCLL